MPTRRESVYMDLPGRPRTLVFDVDEKSRSSPRDAKGNLVLVQNPYSRKMARLIPGTTGPHGSYPTPSVAANKRVPDGLRWESIDNRALAKFNGKLRKGSASLGVTLGSWRQSRDMIVSRTKDIGDAADRIREAARHNVGWLTKIRRRRDPLANQVLEFEFGWLPLYADIHAALTTVCSDAIPAEFVKSRHRERIQTTDKAKHPYNWWREDWSGFATTSISARVSIENPNLWLLNRMGLINPATVAWDLVPWSFVVNMFVNANAMIGSISDHVGLNISERSTTRSWNGLCHYQSQNLFYPDTSYSSSQVRWLDKERVVGSIPSYSWEFKLPKLNWELAVIASSLALQKVKRLNALIRGI